MSSVNFEETFNKLAWLLLLLPGFLFTAVVGYVAEIPDLSEFAHTGYSLMASMLCAVTAWPLVWLACWLRAGRPKRPAGAVVVPMTALVATALLLAPLLGLYYGQAVQNGVFLAIFEQVPGISLLDKASSKRPLVFVLGKNNHGEMKVSGADGRRAPLHRSRGYVRLVLKEKLVYDGWPLYFAHGEKPTEIYLSPACRVDEKGGVTPLPGGGVIVLEAELRAVEILDMSRSECFKAHVIEGAVAAPPASAAASVSQSRANP